ncbi:endonuclease domain-containing protein [Pelagerythrobacter marensis]|uniref:Endonuclease domain-containing protein n=1 Tax=Pelagerythrobacter marensis TaxID=543877 RepID=A0ABZ2D6B4_9SPHN
MITGPRDTIRKARKLRSEMSLPEALLWRELRKRPGGFKFRRQHSAGDYILDFYCAKIRLAIEVDGWTHDNEISARKDARRSAFLRSQGIATTRIPAKLVLEDIEPVVRRIVEICSQRTEKPMVPLHQPAAGPPPRSGEDL